VEEDSAGAVSCEEKLSALEKTIGEYKADVEQFHQDLDQSSNFLQILHSRNRRDEPLTAPYTNSEADRSTYGYFRVIEQFTIEESERYEAGEETFCNIYVWDVTRAMNAEIPHMHANEIVTWLEAEGRSRGWRRVDARMAQEMANTGHPAIAVWRNTNRNPQTGRVGPGHVAVVRPGSVGDQRGNAISAAGRYVVDAAHMQVYFNKQGIQYWYHN